MYKNEYVVVSLEVVNDILHWLTKTWDGTLDHLKKSLETIMNYAEPRNGVFRKQII